MTDPQRRIAPSRKYLRALLGAMAIAFAPAAPAQGVDAGKHRPLEFLSTHPSGETRIEDIQRQLPKVMPLYEAARS